MLPYITVMLAVLVGLSLLAIDGARYYSLQTQMQQAADALALTGARELIQQSGSIAAANRAICNADPCDNVSCNNLVTNGLSAMGEAAIGNCSTTFYSALPDASVGFTGTETKGDLSARFVAVTVSPVTVLTIFPVSVTTTGSFRHGNVNFSAGAQAMAGFTAHTACSFPPLFICNPYEQNGDSDSQATARLSSALYPAPTHPPQMSLDIAKVLGPGHFGYLVPPDGCTGANCLETWISEVNPQACFNSASVSLNIGQKTSVLDAFNVRFDLYRGNLKNNKTDPNFAPSINVRKGYLPNGGNKDWCGATPGYANSFSYYYTYPSVITTGTTTNLSASITNVSNIAGIVANQGQSVFGPGIPSGTTVSAVNGTTVTMSNAATSGSANVSLTFAFITSVPPTSGWTTTGKFSTSNPNIITNVTNASNILVGNYVSTTATCGGKNSQLVIPSSTQVTAVSGTSVTMSNAASCNANNASITFYGYMSGLLMDKVWNGNQGNNDWNCLLYWNINHPNAAAPAGCTASNPTISRYKVYRYEIANGLINDWSGNGLANTQGNAGTGESGAPRCAPAGVDTPTVDRRLIRVAVINCLAQSGNIGGGATATNIPVAGFANFFLSHPVGVDGTSLIYGELIGLASGTKSQVQLYR